jgi:hypothetical protein
MSVADDFAAAASGAGWSVERPVEGEPAILLLRGEGAPDWSGRKRRLERLVDLAAVERPLGVADVARTGSAARTQRLFPDGLGVNIQLASLAGASGAAQHEASLAGVGVLVLGAREGYVRASALPTEIELLRCWRPPDPDVFGELVLLADGEARTLGHGVLSDLPRLRDAEAEPGVSVEPFPDGALRVELGPAYFGARALAVRWGASLRALDGVRISFELEEQALGARPAGTALFEAWRAAPGQPLAK